MDRDAAIVALRNEGLTLEVIGDQFNLTPQCISQILLKQTKKVDRLATTYKKELVKKKHGIIERNEIFDKVSKNWDIYKTFTFQEIALELKILETELRQSISKLQYVYLQANQESSNARQWSHIQCIEILRLAATYSFLLTVLTYRKLVESGTIHGPAAAIFWSRFGSWAKACEAASVEYGEAHREYDRNWNDQELLKLVRAFMFQRRDGRWSIENFEIWRKDPKIFGPSAALLRLHLGTWSEVRVLALTLELPEFNMDSFASLELDED